ncbi:MAG TPA: bacillithiol biosynthesis cysteine-adding enzyme BshC [Vicinamibacterales bacterium]|nr:bacillithiol biosynthesis cysteine-adding enzyme BshC [Vicinamibacterales bacterium]
MFPSALREYEAVPPASGIDVRRFPWIRPLVDDYANNFANVSALFAGDPTSREAWEGAITRAQQHTRRRAEVASLIAAQQARRDAPPEARAAGETLGQVETVAVLTGQQAGVFGGPAYTLFKAITAIQLARRTTAEHGVTAVPIFWVDGEDHDWDEVRTTTVLDAELQPRTVALEPVEGTGQLPIAALTLTDGVDATLAELEASLVRTDFTDWTMSALRAAWRPGEGMSTAFARWLETLLGPLGLVVFESADPSAKPLVADLFARELQFPGTTAALAVSAGDAMMQAGHQPQVVPQPENLSLFKLDGARRPIRRDGDQFVIGDAVHARSGLAAEAVEHPERFSPNVLLRPIVQDAIFPTVCYVAGPGELAYFAQLRGIYEHFGVPMPLIYPRAGATLIDAATGRFLAKYDVPIEALQPQDESALNRLLQSLLPKDVEQALAEAEESVRRTMARVTDVMPQVDPTLAGASKTTLGRMEHDLRALQGKVVQAAKKRDETLRRQFAHAQRQMFPLGHPQERTLGVAFFMNRYGPALVDRLLEELPLDLGKHWVMML